MACVACIDHKMFKLKEFDFRMQDPEKYNISEESYRKFRNALIEIMKEKCPECPK